MDDLLSFSFLVQHSAAWHPSGLLRQAQAITCTGSFVLSRRLLCDRRLARAVPSASRESYFTLLRPKTSTTHGLSSATRQWLWIVSCYWRGLNPGPLNYHCRADHFRHRFIVLDGPVKLPHTKAWRETVMRLIEVLTQTAIAPRRSVAVPTWRLSLIYDAWI